MDEQAIRFHSLYNNIMDRLLTEELRFEPEGSFRTDLAGMRQDVYVSGDEKEIYVVRFFRGEPAEIEVLTPQVHGTFNP